MATDGESITEIFYLIAENPIPSQVSLDLPVKDLNDCCSDFSLKALADTATADPFKNDIAGFIWWFNDVVSSATLTLLKHNGSTYVSSATLNNSTYGTFYSYGFFVNDEGEKFIAYKLEWKKVLTLLGEGSYKVKVDATLSIGGTATLESPEYCLKQYTPYRADKTMKIEYYLNGIKGISGEDKNRKDFGSLNWYNSVRIPGYFGYPNSEYEEDRVQYNNGQRLYVEDEQEPEFVMVIRPIPYFLHEILRTDVMQADTILVTDYNSKNAGKFIQKQVFKSSGYPPKWKPLQSKLAPIELKFKQEFNNLKNFRS